MACLFLFLITITFQANGTKMDVLINVSGKRQGNMRKEVTISNSVAIPQHSPWRLKVT
jgi:hypothetical protein